MKRVQLFIFTCLIIFYVQISFCQNIHHSNNQSLNDVLNNLEMDLMKNSWHKATELEWQDRYDKILLKLDELLRTYPDKKNQILEKEIDLLIPFHPFFHQIFKEPIRTEEAFLKIVQSKGYKEFFDLYCKRLSDLEESMKNDNEFAEQLFRFSRYFIRSGIIDSANYLLNWLEEKYPNSLHNRIGFVQNSKFEANFKVGTIASDFHLSSLNGEEFSLMDLNQDILLFFWNFTCPAGICEPASFEKHLNEYQDNKISVVVVAHTTYGPITKTSDKEYLKERIIKEKIKASVYMSNENILKNYGITDSPPYAFLISKDKRIIGRYISVLMKPTDIYNRVREYSEWNDKKLKFSPKDQVYFSGPL